MDKTFVNVIYLDNSTTRFAFFFITLFMGVPNIALIIVLFILFGKEIIQNNSILLPLGLFSIFNLTMIIISYFILENNRAKSVRILEEGLVYSSMTKKFAVSWDSIRRITINPYSGLRPSVMVDTDKGRFFFTGMYVNTSEELPKVKPGILKPRFYYESGGNFDNDIFKNDLYLTLKSMVPDRFY